MVFSDLIACISELKEKEAIAVVRDRLNNGENPLLIIDEARQGLEIVGRKFETGTFFIPDLVYGGQIVKEVSKMLKGKIEIVKNSYIGKIVIGTVAGDIHDLGKDIVAFIYKVNGFEVIDLGVNVPAGKFIQAIKCEGPKIVGMSCLLTTAIGTMKKTIEDIDIEGLRDNIKIIVGGAIVDDQVAKYVNADWFGATPSSAVAQSKNWIESQL